MTNQEIPLSGNSQSAHSRLSSELYFELGQALLTQGRYKEAKDNFEKALKENVSPALALDIRCSLAQAFEALDAPRQALHIYLETVIKMPEYTRVALLHANKLLTRSLAIAEQVWLRNQWACEVEHIELSTEDRAVVDFFLGRVGTYWKDYDWAQKWFEEAIKDAPDDARAFEGLGEALLRTGKAEGAICAKRSSEAIAVLQQAQQLATAGSYPERLEAIEVKLAQALVATGRYDEALALIRERLSQTNSYPYDLYLIASECYLLMGQSQEALIAADAAAKIMPNASEPDILRARAFIALNEYSSAISSAHQAQQKDPLNTEASFYEIQAMIENPQLPPDQGRKQLQRYVKRVGYSQIIKYLRSPALTVRDQDWHAHYFVARVYDLLLEFLRQNQQGFKQYNRDSIPNVEELLQKALQEVNRASELQPESDPEIAYPEASVQRLQAFLLRDKGDEEAAAKLFYEAGRRYSWQNKYDTAIDLLNCAKVLRPNYTPTYWELSDVLRMRSLQEQDENTCQQMLAESLAIWNEGIKIALPEGSAYSWAYISRALLNEQLAQWYTTDKQQLWWEAIVYLERAILHYVEDAYRWAYLACYHNRLGNHATALHATNLALLQQQDNFAALEERILIFLKIGNYADAKILLEQHQRLTPDSDKWADKIEWANKMLAYVLIHLGELQEAHNLLELIIAEKPEDFWCRNLRALCYQMMDERHLALRDYDWLYNKYKQLSIDSLDVENQVNYAWVAYHLDKIDEAINIFERLRERGEEHYSQISQKLGFCYLHQGAWERGEASLKDGIARSKSVPELENLLNFELSDLENSTSNADYATQLREILRQAKDSINLRIAALTNLPSAEEELKSTLDQLQRSAHTDSWAWIGAQAGLARLYTESSAFSEAEAIYTSLQQYSEQFPEASIVLQKLQ
jgi:tetratricopeptide (TPR) repeat protein